MAMLVDASAAAAVLLPTRGADEMRRRLLGHALYAPRPIDHDLTTVAWRKLRRVPQADVSILDMLSTSPRLELTRADHD